MNKDNLEVLKCEFNTRELIATLINMAYSKKLNIYELIDYIIKNNENGKIFFGCISNEDFNKLLAAYKKGELIK